MGGMFSSSTEAVKQPYEKNPWEPQQEFLKFGFENAQDAFTNAKTDFQGFDPVAGLSDAQRQAMQEMVTSGQQGSDIGGSFLQEAARNPDVVNKYLGNAQDIYNQAGQDQTQDIISGAEQFSSNPYLDSQIDAAISDVRQGFDRDVGTINAGASGSGNINSTRAGVLEARALDDAQDRAGQISSTMRGNAYSEGLDRATMEEQRQYIQAMGANQALGAGGQQVLQQAMMGSDLQGGSLNRLFDAGGADQQQRQAEIDGQAKMNQKDLELVQQYMASIGGNFGSNGYETQIKETPSPFQTILGTASTVAGMF